MNDDLISYSGLSLAVEHIKTLIDDAIVSHNSDSDAHSNLALGGLSYYRSAHRF